MGSHTATLVAQRHTIKLLYGVILEISSLHHIYVENHCKKYNRYWTSEVERRHLEKQKRF